MQIRFQTLKLQNFKNHQDLQIEFKDITKLSGQNGVGKTTILEAITWILFGTDTLGNGGKKFDPSPTTYEFDRVYAELLLSIDGKDVLLAREIEKRKNKVYVNEVPKKVKEFEEVISGMFDKDQFLSLFNPAYFFTMHWTVQRKMIMKYTTAPSRKEVLAEMSRTDPKQKVKDIELNPAASKLAELTKKHSLDDLEKMHRDNKNKKDKAHIAAQSRVKTLQEQLQSIQQKELDVESARQDIKKLDKEIEDLQFSESAEVKSRIDRLQAKYESLLEQIKSGKERYVIAKDKPIEDICDKCGQELKGDALKNVRESHQTEMKQLAESVNEMINEARSIKEELTELRANFKPEESDPEQLRNLFEAKASLQEAIRAKQQREQLEKHIEQAKAEEKSTLESRNESIFILDAIKDFRAKEAELQAAKVQDLFQNLSFRLFEQQKNGEIKPTFEIEMNGKPFSKLSAGEKIGAGLELIHVLQKQSGIVAPVMIDNAESYTGKISSLGQIIACYALPSQTLKIESGDFNADEENLFDVDLEVIS